MASPVFFIKKKDGSLRLVQDYQKLNVMTVKNAYPLPLIPDILNKVSKAKAQYFTQVGHLLGLQQCMDQRGRWVESHLPDEQRFV